MMQLKNVRVLGLCLGISVVCALIADWQAPSAGQTPGARRAQEHAARQNAAQDKTLETAKGEVLVAPIEMPELPQYSGTARYLSGVKFADLPHASCYIMRFSTNATAVQVRDWYKEALENYKWKVNRVTPSLISAVSSKGSSFDLHVQQLKSGCEMHITYKLFQPGSPHH